MPTMCPALHSVLVHKKTMKFSVQQEVRHEALSQLLYGVTYAMTEKCSKCFDSMNTSCLLTWLPGLLYIYFKNVLWMGSEGSERIRDLSKFLTVSNEQARIQQSNLLLLVPALFLVYSRYHKYVHLNTLIITRSFF